MYWQITYTNPHMQVPDCARDICLPHPLGYIEVH